MPVEITKYKCQFKCGLLARSKVEDAIRHESICFKNPETKCCSTCKHEVYHMAWSDDLRSWMHRDCKKIDGEMFDKLFKECDYKTTPSVHVQPIRNCPYHELK